jgi:hypothetical protein
MIWVVRWMRWAPTSIVIAVSLALAGPASAGVLVPPGHAGANQYFEVIPTSAGNAAPPGSVDGSGTAEAGSQALAGFGKGRTGDAQLAKLGKDGQAASALAASTAPRTKGAQPGAVPASGGGSLGSGISRALTGSDSGGLGLVLPLLLGTALVAALGIIAARLRRGPRSSHPGV